MDALAEVNKSLNSLRGVGALRISLQAHPSRGHRLARGVHVYTDFPADWDRYDMTEAVHRPAGMEPGVLSRVVHTCNRRMYAWPVLWRRALRTLWQTRSPLAAMFAWQSTLNYRNVAWSG